jgi:hypothetical protein
VRDDLVGDFGEARAVGHVEPEEQRLLVALGGEPFGGTRLVVLVAIAQRQPHAGIGEGLRHAQPDPRHRAGHEGHAASAHGLSLTLEFPLAKIITVVRVAYKVRGRVDNE